MTYIQTSMYADEEKIMIENVRCCFLYDYWSETTGSLADEEFKSAAPGLEIKIIMGFLCSYLFLSLAQILNSLCERLKVAQRRSKVISVEIIVSISAADIGRSHLLASRAHRLTAAVRSCPHASLSQISAVSSLMERHPLSYPSQ